MHDKLNFLKHSKQIALYLQEIFNSRQITLVNSTQTKHLAGFAYY